MERDALLALLTDEAFEEEPIDVDVKDLRKATVDDLGPNVRVQPIYGTTPGGIPRIGESLLACADNGDPQVIVEHSWFRKFWGLQLGIDRYAQLVLRAADARSRTIGDVEVLDFDASDDVVVRLSYAITSPERQLDRLLAAGDIVEAHVREAAEAVDQGITDAVERAERRLDGWGEQPLDALIDAMRAGTAHEKGQRLEELTSRLFQQVPGFTAAGHVNTSTEEIDVRIQNGSDDPFWRRESAMLIAECKNWSTACGAPEFTIFRSKVEGRVGRVKCGFLISWNGFTDTIEKQMLKTTTGEHLIVPITGAELRAAVRDNDFPDRLKAAYEQAVYL